MIYDFTLAETLRLANVRRWGIVEMSRPQSVAEHTCNVMLIALNIAETYNEIIVADKIDGNNTCKPINEKQMAALMKACLTHDLPEIYSGDIPTPTKRAIGRPAFQEWERERFPLLTQLIDSLDPVLAKVKGIADVYEAILYTRKWCVDGRAEMILNDLKTVMDESLYQAGDMKPAELATLARAVRRVEIESSKHGGMS